jgi:hypothetical protein
MYCQPPKGSLDHVDDLERYEYEDGSNSVLFAGYAVVVPPVFGMAFATLRLRAGPPARRGTRNSTRGRDLAYG